MCLPLFGHTTGHVTSYNEYDYAHVGIFKEHFQEYLPIGIGLMQHSTPVCGPGLPWLGSSRVSNYGDHIP